MISGLASQLQQVADQGLVGNGESAERGAQSAEPEASANGDSANGEPEPSEAPGDPVAEAEAAEHNRLFEAGWKLLDPYLVLDGRSRSRPGWFGRRNLQRARDCFRRALEVKSLPTSIILSSEADLLGSIEGFVATREFAEVLHKSIEFQRTLRDEKTVAVGEPR